MAPIRRYLRITKYSVIEVRIYLDNPAWAETWLLRRNNPALPRIIEAIRPDVLPKLREENERARRGGKKSAKKVGTIRDKVKGDDFEVSMFYTTQTTPHSLLSKHKTFSDKPRLTSNSDKLTSWLTFGSNEKPITLDDDSAAHGDEPIVVREEDDREINLMDIPEASVREPSDDEDASDLNESATAVNARRSRSTARGSKRAGKKGLTNEHAEELEVSQGIDENSKKKLNLTTSYEGFSIYGRTLCLMVKRTGPGAVKAGDNRFGAASSQQMMETWVSTQAQKEEEGLVGLVDG